MSNGKSGVGLSKPILGDAVKTDTPPLGGMTNGPKNRMLF